MKGTPLCSTVDFNTFVFTRLGNMSKLLQADLQVDL